MQEFFLDVDGRIVRILLEDARGDDGAVPTLVCREARMAQVLPAPVEDESRPWFPRFPRALIEQARYVEAEPAQLRVDTHDLPSGSVPFEIGAFARKVADEIGSGVTAVELTRSNAHQWGGQVVEHGA
jgi:hypothetical protein